MNKEQAFLVPIEINNWWNSLSELQQVNLANSIFNRFNDWIDIYDFNLTDNDKKLLYIYSNCL